MTVNRSSLGLNAQTVIAERVRQQLERFPEKFGELGESGELRKLCRKTTTLSGPKVQQSPEDFTEQYLIEPVLHGLGYWNPISEEYTGTGPHFVRRPSTYHKIEIKRPDYLLKNISPTLDCILEAKAANEEQPTGTKRKATDDVRTYVEDNTFAKYLESREKRYLVAIGTDGFRWVLWAKDVRTGETKEAITEVDLEDAISDLAKQAAVIEGESEQTTAEIRRFLTSEFITPFAARSLPEFVHAQFE